MRPVVFDPGLFGEYGGPANGGFAGTGTNTSYSGAGTWTRVISAKTVLDVRGGLNYYRNVTSTTGQGPHDQHRRRHSRRQPRRLHERHFLDQHRQLHRIRSLGFSASQPWDRWEKTWNVTSTLTRLLSSPHVKVGTASGGHNSDMLLQTQDAGGPRGRFTFNAVGHRPARRDRVDDSAARQLHGRRSCSTGRSAVSRDLKVFDDPGTKH